MLAKITRVTAPNPPFRGPIRFRLRHARAGLIAFVVGALLVMTPDVGSAANGPEDAFLQMKKPIAAPRGFASVCGRYDWACGGGTHASVAEADILKLARSVNRKVNAGFRQVTDSQQYGVQEVWALPTGRGGDCEDFVLLKKLALMKQGVPGARLLIATVLDRHRSPHAVLVLRTGSGDLVLDNLGSQIKPWNETGYTFLRVQNPNQPSSWQAVFAGGIFRDL